MAGLRSNQSPQAGRSRALLAYCRFEEDGIDVGERTAKGHAVSGENSVESRPFSFQLLVVTQYTLTLITIVLSWREKLLQLMGCEREAVIVADRQVCGVGGKPGLLIESVIDDVEDPDSSLAVLRNCHRRERGLHLARNKVRLANLETAVAVRGQADNAQPVVSRFGIAVAEDDVNVAVIRIDRDVINSSEKSIHRPKLRLRLSALSRCDLNSCGASVQGPSVAAVSRAIQEPVDGLRIGGDVVAVRNRGGTLLKQSVDSAAFAIDR